MRGAVRVYDHASCHGAHWHLCACVCLVHLYHLGFSGQQQLFQKRSPTRTQRYTQVQAVGQSVTSCRLAKSMAAQI